MPFMEKGAFKLYYEDSGKDLPAILFLHGAGGNHLSWWQQNNRGSDAFNHQR